MSRKIKKWKPKLSNHYICTIIGSRGCGKSQFAKFCCLFKNGALDQSSKIYVMTTLVNAQNWSFIPKKNIIINYQPKALQMIMDYQEKCLYSKKLKLETITIIIDDLITNSNKKNKIGEYYGASQYCPTLLKLYLQGRHYFCNLFLISQSQTLVGNNFLRNTTYLIWFRMGLKRDRQKMVEIVGLYGDEDEIHAMIEKPRQYECFVFEMLSGSYNLEEKLFYYKVPIKFINL